MKKPVVLIGVGEMGGVFARGLLKLGHVVVPVRRGDSLSDAAKEIFDPEAVVVGVGEKDLHSTLQSMPDVWKDKLVLLQNELLPRDWEQYNLSPTVISVWFEKKPGMDAKVIIPSPIFGDKSQLIHDALATISIPVNIVANEQELLKELVIKNLYIVTINIEGLFLGGGTVEQLWKEEQELTQAVMKDVLDIQFKLIDKELDREELIAGMLKAFEGDWSHKCMGRTASARLERALEQADEFGLDAVQLKKIKEKVG